MSDTPRLTRKQLRELGKLEVKSPDAPSLTDTQELRLRRPSRKELREAEKLRAAARAVAEAPEKLERKSVFSRFQSEDGEVKTPENTANGESPVITAEEPIVVQPAAAEKLSEKSESAPTAEKELDKEVAADVDAAADVDIDLDAALAAGADADANADNEAPRSLRERLVMRTRRDKIKASESPAAAEISAEEAEVAIPEVPSGEEAGDSAVTAQEENSADENLEAAAIEDSAAGEKVEVAELVEVAEPAETVEPAKKVDTKAAAAAEEKAAEIKSEKSEKEKKANSGGERSSRRAWFMLFVLIAIGIIVGYLGGSLINLFFFSAAGEISDFAVSTALLL